MSVPRYRPRFDDHRYCSTTAVVTLNRCNTSGLFAASLTSDDIDTALMAVSRGEMP